MGILRSRLAWSLAAANLIALLAVIYFSRPGVPAEGLPFSVAQASFSDLDGWSRSDPRPALEAFRRSCAVLEALPADQEMGWGGYAGKASDWKPVCAALPPSSTTEVAARDFFEDRFSPLALSGGKRPRFTGYYEPVIRVSWNRNARFRVPLYSRPSDLISADLGEFSATLAGRRIFGRLAGSKLVPYATRAEIDRNGVPQASVLLYADDPIAVFFLQIQGSGRARFGDGRELRIQFAATNGEPYTSIGKVLIDEGAVEKKGLSMQRIRAWLAAHPSRMTSLFEQDRSYVFFSLAPINNPALGSAGSEGVPLTAGASIAADTRLNPLGAPAYLVGDAHDVPSDGQTLSLNRLAIIQDSGGAITGPGRADIFFGAGRTAEAIAGRLNATGRLYVLVPKSVAQALALGKVFPDAPL